MTEETIFTHALQKHSPAERQAFLDEACAGDRDLRQRIEALLNAQAAGDFLDVPALAQVAAAPRLGDLTQAIDGDRAGDAPALDFLAASPKAGSLGRLAHYEVQEVVGKGGMGVVVKAFDDKLHRVVAIKALAPALASSGTARQRFVREAQAAAAVSHDHVVACSGDMNIGVPAMTPRAPERGALPRFQPGRQAARVGRPGPHHQALGRGQR
jgi:serine/threonine protein kinase